MSWPEPHQGHRLGKEVPLEKMEALIHAGLKLGTCLNLFGNELHSGVSHALQQVLAVACAGGAQVHFDEIYAREYWFPLRTEIVVVECEPITQTPQTAAAGNEFTIHMSMLQDLKHALPG